MSTHRLWVRLRSWRSSSWPWWVCISVWVSVHALFLTYGSSSFFLLFFFFFPFFLSLSIYLSFPTQLRRALVRSSCYTRCVPPINALSMYRDIMCAFTTLIKVCVCECVCVCACVRVRVCVCRCWGDIQSLTFNCGRNSKFRHPWRPCIHPSSFLPLPFLFLLHLFRCPWFQIKGNDI